LEAITLIRPMASRDLDAVVGIQAKSPGAAQWNRETYAAIVSGQGSGLDRCLVAEVELGPVGFACFRAVASEAELLNLAVLPDNRRRGIGARLMEKVIQEARASGARELFLEVRDSNLPALGLYRRIGFERHSRRPGYYRDPPADALTMHLRLASPKS
jgi:[ribosomal protein S18]-alanine N-acetyltransferase